MSADATDFAEIAETFDLLDDWEERYRYVIDLGKKLPGLADADKTAATKVDGCVSQVWLVARLEPDAEGEPRLHFDGDSDAHIVRGLIAVLKALLSGRRPVDIVETDAMAAFHGLGFDAHLSPQRSNGLRAMIERVRALAKSAAPA